MLVFKKGQLLRKLKKTPSGMLVVELTHVKTNTKISVEFDPKFNQDYSFYKPEKYLISREENGFYELYEEFKTEPLISAFELAISAFELAIFKKLNETPPQSQPPTDPSKDRPELIKEYPDIGEIIKIGQDFYQILDIDTEFNSKLKKLSKAKAMKNLQLQKNLLIEDFNTNNEQIMEKGGAVEKVISKNLKNSSFVILRPQPPAPIINEEQADFPNDDNSSLPMPENVEDPFDENSDSDSSDSDSSDSDEFGNEGLVNDSFEDLMQQIESGDVGWGDSDVSKDFQTDLKTIEQFVGASSTIIKESMTSKTLKQLLKGALIFDKDNSKRIEKAIEKIFQ